MNLYSGTDGRTIRALKPISTVVQ